MPLNINAQAISNVDDGSETGRTRTQDVVGGLVKLPFLEGMFTVPSTTASSTCSLTSNFENSDGSGMILTANLAANPTPGAGTVSAAISIHMLFHGPAFGIRLLRGYQNGTNNASVPFVVLIDGVPYNVDPTGYFPGSGNVITPPFYSKEDLIPIADDLSEGFHDAEFRFQNTDPGTTLAPWFVIYGYAAARAAGYTEYPRLGSPYTPAAVATGSAAALPQSGTAAFRFRACRKVQYYNSTAGAIVVTISWGGTNCYVLSVPATGVAEWDPGREMSWIQLTTNFKHVAASSGITCWVMGAF